MSAPTPEACREAGKRAALQLRELAAVLEVPGEPSGLAARLRAQAVALVGAVLTLLLTFPASWRPWMAMCLRRLEAGIRTHSSSAGEKRTGWIYVEISAGDVRAMVEQWETWAGEIGGGDRLPVGPPVVSGSETPAGRAARALRRLARGQGVCAPTVGDTWTALDPREQSALATSRGEAAAAVEALWHALPSLGAEVIAAGFQASALLGSAPLDSATLEAWAKGWDDYDRGTQHGTDAKATPNPEGPPIFPLVVRRQNGTGGAFEEEDRMGVEDPRRTTDSSKWSVDRGCLARFQAARLSRDGSIATISEVRPEGEVEIGRYLGGEEMEIPKLGGGDRLPAEEAAAVPIGVSPRALREGLMLPEELAEIGERWARGKRSVDAGEKPDPVNTALIVVRVPALLKHGEALGAWLGRVVKANQTWRKIAKEARSLLAPETAGLPLAEAVSMALDEARGTQHGDVREATPAHEDPADMAARLAGSYSVSSEGEGLIRVGIDAAHVQLGDLVARRTDTFGQLDYEGLADDLLALVRRGGS